MPRAPGGPKPLEARALTLNPRGEVYVCFGRPFPQGEWQAVSEGEAAVLGWRPAFEIREKEGD